MTTAQQIAKTARTNLNRPARTGRHLDWDAIAAVKSAAVELGFAAPLEAWAPRAATSLTGLADAYLARYAEAYGVGAA